MRRSTGELWEAFARDNAEYYILTEVVSYSGSDDLGAFFESGERDAETILAEAEGLIPELRRAVDFGAGVGRLAIPMARRFEHILAVDIAPTMLERLLRNCADRDIRNVAAVSATGSWHEGVAADFVYSRIVLQHIEESHAFRTALVSIASALRVGGIASLHVDTRPLSPAYQVIRRTPDAVLPRPWRRGIRRTRRRRADVLAMLENLGLIVERELRPHTAHHVILARATGVRPA